MLFEEFFLDLVPFTCFFVVFIGPAQRPKNFRLHIFSNGVNKCPCPTNLPYIIDLIHGFATPHRRMKEFKVFQCADLATE